MKKTKKHIIAKEKGITLITLVVTIVIILILAGISIGTIVNEGGLFKGAQDTKNSLENQINDTSGKINSLLDELNEFNTPLEEPVGPNGKPLVTNTRLKIIDADKNREVEDKYGNKVIIPQGFKIAADSGTTVPEGIVIEDGASTQAVGTEGAEGYKPATTGNQFVWIPVGTVNMNETRTTTKQVLLGRYTFNTTTGEPTPVQLAFNDDGTENYISNGTETEYLIYNYYYELSTERQGIASSGTDGLNATAKELGVFLESAKNNGGYYIARYEASYGTGFDISKNTETESNKYSLACYENAKPLSKKSIKTGFTASTENPPTEGSLWNYITELAASKVSRNMYNNDSAVGVGSDLMNSYAFDTAIVYISQMKEEYANFANFNSSTSYGTDKNVGSKTSRDNTGANLSDKFCNIYDMVANCREWTTEHYTGSNSSGAYPCVVRGGVYSNMDYFTARRYYSGATSSNGNLGFRSLCYIK